MKNMQTVVTLVTLGNAAEVVARTAERVLGGEVADTFGGTPLTREIIYQQAHSSIEKALAKKLGE